MSALGSLAELGRPDSRFQSLLSVRAAALLGAVGAILTVVVADLPEVGMTLGIWDALHHRDHHIVGLRGIPLWWVTSCLVWDFGAAFGLLTFV